YVTPRDDSSLRAGRWLPLTAVSARRRRSQRPINPVCLLAVASLPYSPRLTLAPPRSSPSARTLATAVALASNPTAGNDVGRAPSHRRLFSRWCYPGNALLRTCRKKALPIQYVAD